MSVLRDAGILGLTVRSPHAQLIARDIKTIEGRGWPPYDWMLGRYIAIHASRAWDQEGHDFYARNEGRFALGTRLPTWAECDFGVIAVVRLVGWVQRAESGPPRTIKMLQGYAFGDQLDPLGRSLDERWFTRLHEYGWVLRDVVRISPVACDGRQKLWRLDPKVYDLVRKRWGEASRSAATRPSAGGSAGTPPTSPRAG